MHPLILIVDDHEGMRESLRVWLSGVFADCAFIEASSGEEAIELATQNRPNVILMDIALPKINGIEATRQIIALLPETHVVMLSIHDEARYKADAADAGAAFIVSKFAMQNELLPIVAGLLSGNGHDPLVVLPPAVESAR